MKFIVMTTMLVSAVTAGAMLGNHLSPHVPPLDESTFDTLLSGELPAPPWMNFAWPPEINEQYPDLQLLDQEGNLTRLSDFRGKIILVEPVGMPCKACQAMAGGHQLGGFDGIQPQPNIPALPDAARTYGDFNLDDDRLVKIYLLLYGMDMQAPTPEDAAAWAEHFKLDRSRNEIVLAGLPEMICPESYAMIPGLQVIDQNFIYRIDATGRANQRHDLYRFLLPTVGLMLKHQ